MSAGIGFPAGREQGGAENGDRNHHEYCKRHRALVFQSRTGDSPPAIVRWECEVVRTSWMFLLAAF